MSDRLTAEPGTLEFLRQLLEIARESGHPIDKALTKVLSKQIGRQEVEDAACDATWTRIEEVENVT